MEWPLLIAEGQLWDCVQAFGTDSWHPYKGRGPDRPQCRFEGGIRHYRVPPKPAWQAGGRAHELGARGARPRLEEEATQMTHDFFEPDTVARSCFTFDFAVCSTMGSSLFLIFQMKRDTLREGSQSTCYPGIIVWHPGHQSPD